jgi:hypothetical protein
MISEDELDRRLERVKEELIGKFNDYHLGKMRDAEERHQQTIEKLKSDFQRFHVLEQKKAINAVKQKMLQKMKDREDVLRQKVEVEAGLKTVELQKKLEARFEAGEGAPPDLHLMKEIREKYETDLVSERRKLEERYRNEILIRLEQQRAALLEEIDDDRTSQLMAKIPDSKAPVVTEIVHQQVDAERNRYRKAALAFGEELTVLYRQREEALLDYAMEWIESAEERFRKKFLTQLEERELALDTDDLDGDIAEIAQDLQDEWKGMMDEINTQIEQALEEEREAAEETYDG